MTTKCPSCEASTVTSCTQIDKFQYGRGHDAVVLETVIPLYSCATCGFTFTDHAAERVRQAAVCRHLGLLTPQEIVDLRKGLGLTRDALAKGTGVGIASLARWESGETVQNRSIDNLLFLLQFPENLGRLQQRGDVERPLVGSKVVPLSSHCRFRALGTTISSELKERSETFTLQRAN